MDHLENFEKLHGQTYDLGLLNEEKLECYTPIIAQLHVLNRELQSEKATYPNVYFDVISDSTFKASVRRKDDTYYLAISIGAFYILDDIFSRFMCHKDVLAEIGNSSFENELLPIEINDYKDYRELFKKRPTNESIQPIDKIRRSASNIMLFWALKYLFLHEYGHILYGHVDFYNSNEALELDDTFLTKQTIEYDADAFATNIALVQVMRFIENPNTIGLRYKELMKDSHTIMLLWTFTLKTLFKIMSGVNNDYEDLTNKDYPPAGIRMHMINSTVITILHARDPERLNIFMETLNKTIQDVVTAFSLISGQKKDFHQEHNTYVKEGTLDHGKLLMKHWNKVRPLLEPFAYANLPPLFEED
jgi:hypothetical protein